MKKILLFALTGLLLGSCKDFLTDYAQKKAYIYTPAIMKETLLGECVMPIYTDVNSTNNEPELLFLHLMSDEFKELYIPYDGDGETNPGTHTWDYTNNVFYRKAGWHRWADDPFTNGAGESYKESAYEKMYRRIKVINAIFVEAEKIGQQDLSDDDRKLFNHTMASGHFLRAWNYFMLANIYGAAYDPADPDKMESVVYTESAEVTRDKVTRQSPSFVYGKIIEDLLKAEEYMEMTYEMDPVYKKGNKRDVSMNAINAMLSRVYLYMCDYPNAAARAQMVIDDNYAISTAIPSWTGVNFNPMTVGSSAKKPASALALENSETIWAQGSYGLNYIQRGTGEWVLPSSVTGKEKITKYRAVYCSRSYVLSDELAGDMAKYGNNDMRKHMYCTKSFAALPTQTKYLLCRKYRSTPIGINGKERTATDNLNKFGRIYEYYPMATTAPADTIEDYKSNTSINEIGSIRFQEVYFNWLEARACMSDTWASVQSNLTADYINKRYWNVTRPTMAANFSTQEALIKFIREQRRIELCCEGHRWFDIRRYAVNDVCKQEITIKHAYYVDTQTGPVLAANKYVIAPYSDATKGSWIMPPSYDALFHSSPELTRFNRTAGVTRE